MGTSVVGAFIATLATFNTLVIPDNVTGTVAKFAFCIVFGWGTNDIINKLGVDGLPKPDVPKKP